jgi:type IV pilus assembly protein PilM
MPIVSELALQILGEQQRPRLACELRPEGVTAAAGAATNGALSQVAWEPLPEGAMIAGIHKGNLIDAPKVTAAIAAALGKVSDSKRDVTLILPDACVRVLLVDFDALPSKHEDALPVVSFRLKKLLPFEVEDAAVSYQVLSNSKKMVRVLAVAIAKETLAEFEFAVRAAGYEPGSVVPSTLAVLSAMGETASTMLITNISEAGMTTAVLHGGELQLHRSQGLSASNGTVSRATEIIQMVNVVSAWTEDTFGAETDGRAYAAGSYAAPAMNELFSGATEFHRVEFEDVIELGQMLADAATANVPRQWLAGVAGALRVG